MSVPAKLIVTGFRYQPLWSGARSGEGVTVGGVASYLKLTLAAPLVFPATSVHVPDRPAVALSAPEYVGAVQPPIPETASCPPKDAATGWLYQPSESGPRPSDPPTPVGAVLSILIETTGL